MEKLEQYLDQVCRGIGGPMEMRRHVRQELREHLLDAVAQHKAAGMSDEDALTKALEEFGKPEEVRSELEAAHGQRMTWIIDKAMQWKEMTMRAKWLWMSWAYAGLVLVILLQALFITFNVVFIIPKFKKLLHDGIIDPAIMEEDTPRRMVNFLHDLEYVAGNHTLLLLVVPAVLWGLFEWRVRSDNKSFMRLSALGTAAVALTVVVALMAGSMIICFCLGVPAVGRLTRPWAVEQVTTLDASVKRLEQSLAEKNWKAMPEQVEEAISAAKRLSVGPAATALANHDNAKIGDLRAQIKGMHHHLAKAREAIREQDAAKVQGALDEFRKVFEPVREAAKKSAP